MTQSSASTASVLFELTESIGEVDDDATATPRALVALVAGEHLEFAAIDKEPDLDEIVAADFTGVCVGVAHTH